MKVKNICVGHKYTDKSGTEKTQWEIIGKMFVKDDGKTSIVIKSIPVGWDGSAIVFEQKKEEQQKASEPQTQQVQHTQNANYDDDGVPF